MREPIQIEHREEWHKLTLNRPDKLNALNVPMLRALIAALEAARDDASCRAVLLTGEGRGFCSGQELGDEVMPAADGTPPNLEALASTWHHRVVALIRSLPIPVVAAVNGVAAGAGASFALAADITLAARSASFVLAFARIGLVPDSGATFFLPRLIGEARARALALLTTPLSAEQAERWGMIWQVVDDSELVREAEAVTARLATQATAAIAATKQLFNVSSTNGLATQLSLEATAQGARGRSPDFAEGVRAFVEKRPARFTGRDA
jgi:2-(1,2-epoxy-1,2-dihydrophenyl)acetyl-CoA isomerase